MNLHSYLKEISLEAIAKCSQTNDAGLIGGKMGLCINVYELGKAFNDEELIALGDNMLDDVFSLIQTETTVDFSSGILGIGWGIEHLVQNGFVDADTNEVLLDLDNRLFTNKLLGVNTTMDLNKGFLGVGSYYIKRLQNERSTDEIISVLKIKQNLISIIEQLDWAKGIAFQQMADPFKLVQAVQLQLVFSLIHDLHKLNLFNSRLNKVISWLAQNQSLPVSDKAVEVLPFLYPLIKVNKLLPADDLFNTLIIELTTNLTREKILQEVKGESVALSLDVFKEYNNLLRENFLFKDEYSFWQERSMAFLKAYSQNYTAGNGYEQAIQLGLLNGFNGFYKILPAIYGHETIAGQQQEKSFHH